MWFMIGHRQLSLLIMGAYWYIDNYRLFIYRSDFAEKWLKGVYMCRDDTCEMISLSDQPIKSYTQKLKCSIGWGILGFVWNS